VKASLPVELRLTVLSSDGRAVALARHFREEEDLSVGQIADRLGRAPATIKVYFYDPTRERAPGRQGSLRRCVPCCGAYTQPATA
jgi:hypothetical protein